jgi:hypothetical protein
MRGVLKGWPGALMVMVVMSLTSSTPAFADNINPGVFGIGSTPFGLKYGDWSARWWQWAVSQTTFDNCPNESGPVWFLSAAQTSCVIPANTAIMFPTFNVEWSAAEANVQGRVPQAQGTCLVPTYPNGTSYAALLACARVQAANVTGPGGSLEASVDGTALQRLTQYRAQSTPPPFTITAVSGNQFGIPPGSSQSVAVGYWIMLMPPSAGKHLIHFGATVPFPTVNPPATPFTFTTSADYCVIVQPSGQTCP